MNIGTLIQVDFDTLENQYAAARQTTDLATFVDDDKGTAFAKCDEFLRAMPPVRFYLGWDKNIYPKFIYQVREAR